MQRLQTDRPSMCLEFRLILKSAFAEHRLCPSNQISPRCPRATKLYQRHNICMPVRIFEYLHDRLTVSGRQIPPFSVTCAHIRILVRSLLIMLMMQVLLWKNWIETIYCFSHLYMRDFIKGSVTRYTSQSQLYSRLVSYG